jgi:RNA polymerase sigma-70 factor (ECF subfamily)
MSKYTDKELLEIFHSGRKNYAFNLLVETYKQQLYWHIRRMVLVHDDADDVLQNTLIKAWKGLPLFREKSSLYTWLYRIATNESISFLNKKRRKYLLPLTDVESHLSNSLESDVYFNGNEAQKQLQQAVLKLPEKQRLIFNMKYFDDLKYEEISQILDTSIGALKASYHHAVRKIEEYIKNH